MAGGTRSELASSSPEGSAFTASYPNGQRGSYSGPSMERSGSFRESLDCRVSSSGAGVTRSPTSATAAEIRPLSSVFMLEPLSIGDQKYNRYGELRRAFGLPLEEHQSRFLQFKPLPPEELKNFKVTLQEVPTRARERVKYFNEAVLKLDKYRNLMTRKKSRSENTTFEKSVGMSKMVNLINHNPSDPATQRQEERAKNTLPNKRIRSSMTDVRSEGRVNALSRQGTIVERDKLSTDREKNMLRTCNGGLAEDKSRVLSTGGEGWNNNKSMKRKRSTGLLATRSLDPERDIKQALPQRFKNEPRPRPSDGVGFRPGSSTASIGASKSDGSSQHFFCGSRAPAKSEVDNSTLSNDRREHSSTFEKERNLAKGTKLAFREDSLVGSQGHLTKGKASRVPRAGSGSIANSSSTVRTTGGLDGWEQTPSSNKNQLLNIPNNRKRPLSTGPSSPHVAQWGGQRPHRIRMRRTSLVSPVSGHDDSQNVVTGSPASDVGARLPTTDAGGSVFSRGISGVPYQSNMKFENVDSPAILSESEESGAAEKGNNNGDDGGLNAASRKMNTVVLPVKKNKLPKEESGDGVRRLGRSVWGLPQSKAGFSLMKEKSENNHTTKPMRNGRPCSDRSESKVGRPPSKKAGERKSFTRPGQVLHSGSAELTGDCEDDYNELFVAANSARNSLDQASSTLFWKTMSPFFEFVGSDSMELLKRQISFAEELDENLCITEDKVLVSQERKDKQAKDAELGKPSRTMCSLDEDHQIGETFETNDWLERVVPLSQRLIAAILPEFETDCKNDHQDSFSQFTTQNSYVSRCLGDSEGKDKEHMAELQSEFEMTFPSRNGYVAVPPTNFRSPVTNNHSYINSLPYSDAKVHSDYIQNSMDRMQNVETDYYSNSLVSQYEHMSHEDKLLLELQSIGLHPETVPDLSDGEDEPIDKDISKFKMMLYQKARGKLKGLVKLDKAVQDAKMREERRNMEKLALDQLVERSYKKFLGGRGNHHGSGIKGGVNKVSKQAALDFGMRALARYQKFESSDQSCFSEAPFRNILFSPSQLSGNTKLNGIHTGVPVQAELQDLCSNMVAGHGFDRSSGDSLQGLAHTPDQSFAKHEMVSKHRGKKREVLLDDVGNAALLRHTATLGCSIPGGAKGKRSERERDQNTSGRNSVSKIGRPLTGGPSRGERKSKTKLKQKTAQLSASGVLLGRNTEADSTTTTSPLVHESCEARNHGNNINSYKGNERASNSLHQSQTPSQEISKETEAPPIDLSNLPLQAIDSIEVDLGVGDGLGEQDQDFGSWFNIEDDILADNDITGLEIPMDDLAELDMNF